MASTDQPTTPPEQPGLVEPTTEANDRATPEADLAPSEAPTPRSTESEPDEPEPPESEPDEPEPPESEPDEPEPTESEPDEPEPTESGPDEPESAKSEPTGAAPTSAEGDQAEPASAAATAVEPVEPAHAPTLELVPAEAKAGPGSEKEPAPSTRTRRRTPALPAPSGDAPASFDEPERDAAEEAGGADAVPFQVSWTPEAILSSEDPFEQAAPPAATSLLFQAPQRVLPASQPPLEPVADSSVATSGSQPPETSSGPTAEPSEDDERSGSGNRRRRRGGKGRRSKSSAESGAPAEDHVENPDAGASEPADAAEDDAGEPSTRRRTRRRRRSGSSAGEDGAPGVVTKVREPRREGDGVLAVRGSTRLEAKKQRRREGREAGRRRTVLTEAEYLARRESVERVMLVRRTGERTQIAVLEDGVLVEHYVSSDTNTSMAGNIHVGRVQNVLPSMEAAFVDIGKGRNAVLYAGEVNWDAAGMESGQPKRIENALEPGQSVLVQVTKDPIGHKGARLTSQVSLPGRYLVYVPDSAMTGISRKLPDVERARLKRILRDVVPETAGVIVRTAAEGATEAELRADVERLTATWDEIRSQVEALARKAKGGAPAFLHGEPDLTVRVVRDIFNEDFASLVVAGEAAWQEVGEYVQAVAPDLADRLSQWTGEEDLFAHHRVDEQIAKAMDRKVWLPSGGSLVIDRTEAMTVVDVNTGKFVGSGGNLEETVTRNNIEAAEEIVRQLRLRDIGGIIVIDFIDMVLESNRDLVVRRLLECLGRDRTKHQVAEVTSLGLVQMTRKRVGAGLLEVFSEPCEHCNGRGYLVSSEPSDRSTRSDFEAEGRGGSPVRPPQPPAGGPTPAQIAAAAHAAAVKSVDEAAAPSAADAVSATDERPADAVVFEQEGAPAAGSVTPAGAPAVEVPRTAERGPAVEGSAAEEGTPAAPVSAIPTGPAAAEGSATEEGTPAAASSAVPEAVGGPAQESTTPGDVRASSEEQASASATALSIGHDGPAVAPEPPAAPDVPAAPDAGEPPAPARRRRHGRVVAPAGPPRVGP